jgi:hypothetical protein
MSSYICLNLGGRAQEWIQVARALHVVQHNIDVSLRAVLSIQVDGICVRVPARDAKKLERRIKSIRYCDLHKLTSPLPRAVAKVRQTPSTSTEQVYKCEALEEPKYPGGRLEIAPHVPPPYPEPLEWNVVREPMEGDDTFVDDVLAHVLGGKNCCIEGPLGTGKSWMLRQIREALEKDGQNVRVAAPTNKAARLVDGITLHNFVSRYCRNGSFRGVLLIDEISMLHLGLISSCDHLRLGDCRIICLGDWAQLPVVGNSWRGTPIDPQIFRHSRLYRVCGPIALALSSRGPEDATPNILHSTRPYRIILRRPLSRVASAFKRHKMRTFTFAWAIEGDSTFKKISKPQLPRAKYVSVYLHGTTLDTSVSSALRSLDVVRAVVSLTVCPTPLRNWSIATECC